VHVSVQHPPGPHLVQSLLQEETQVPSEQISDAAHATPHAPQLAGSALSLTQLSPHSVSPGPHALMQSGGSPAQSGIAPVQRRPHTPQSASVVSRVSQPFEASPSQSAKSASQRRRHAPAVQRLVAFGGPRGQARLHMPQ
jgi:hypothetical protein